nr:MAG: biopolymer transporter ExbD [Hyphomicrobiales bacterium]
MSFSVGGDDSGAMVNMNLVPLIDVMLVLLILFIVTIPIQTHAVKLDMPTPNAEPPPPDQASVVIDLEVDFDGTVIWNGSPVANRVSLRSYFETISVQDPQPEIHLRPNRLARYETVARVLADAQSLGVTKIGFVGTGEFSD